jgi:integrase
MLTDTKLRKIKPAGKAIKLADEKGLYIYVAPSGGISFRYDYRLNGKRATLTLGRYPDLSLGEAREQLAGARSLVAAGQSPARTKQHGKIAARVASGNTFKAIAESWFEKIASRRSGSWNDLNRRWLDRDIYPVIGHMPMNEIEPQHVLAIMESMDEKGIAKSAEYARGLIAQIFKFAVLKRRAKANPASGLRGAIMVPAPKHREPLTAKNIPAFIEALDAYSGRLSTKLAIKLLMLTFVRKNELSAAEKNEFDLEAAEWRIPSTRMKMREAHIVPLSRQAVECVRELIPMACGSRFLLPNIGSLDKPMGGTTFNKAIDAMGYGGKFTPHGFRATASSLLNEKGFRPDVIERQLAHTERNRVRAAYNRAEYLEDRRQMMQTWADYVDSLVAGGNVTPIRKGRAA